MRHLGNRVSALLDGQLGVEEEERAWAHVHTCALCQSQVAQLGWVRTRLRSNSADSSMPSTLKAGILSNVATEGNELAWDEPRRLPTAALMGGAALGAAGIAAATVMLLGGSSVQTPIAPANIGGGTNAPTAPVRTVVPTPAESIPISATPATRGNRK